MCKNKNERCEETRKKAQIKKTLFAKVQQIFTKETLYRYGCCRREFCYNLCTITTVVRITHFVVSLIRFDILVAFNDATVWLFSTLRHNRIVVSIRS